MEINEIKTKIKFAIDAVDGIDKDYKIEAFKIILSKELNVLSSSPVPKIEASGIPKPPSEAPKLSELVAKLGISEEEIGNVVSIIDDKIEMHYTFEGSDKQNMINFSMCYLIIKFYIFKNEWIKSTEIANAMKKIGIEDKSGNFTAYVKNETSIFVKRGKGKELEFKLVTPKGREIALSVLKNLIKPEK